MKKSILIILIFLFYFPLRGWDNCYTIIAGRDATVSGSVMIAHNEDDKGKNFFVDVHKIGKSGENGRTIKLKNGRLLRLSKGYGFLWLEIAGTEFADSYINEKGVVIVSNACLSREDNPSLVDGGIGMALRRIVAEQAENAREAVEIAGQLVEKYGYYSSGRTYAFADAREGWLMHIVKGKHWAAKRIPDDSVAIIPNYYTIDEINLNDRNDYMGSKDIIDYAVKRGWYNKSDGEKFSFRKAYSDPKNLISERNTLRHWRGFALLSKLKVRPGVDLSFSFKPAKKIKIQDIFTLLRDHYEGTAQDLSNGYKTGSPNFTQNRTICTGSTRYSIVAELRQNLPDEIATLVWIAFRRPDSNSYSPWYPSIVTTPNGYTRGNSETAFLTHMKKNDDYFRYDTEHAYWSYAKLSERVDDDYRNNIKQVKKMWANFEQSLLKNIKKKEREFAYLLGKNRVLALNMITNYVHNIEFRKWFNTIDLFNTLH
ncbi:MAG: C69 family dipeptidase [Candidatus Aminicenantes bacterium]|nr:C69 family dipeptidase [Candidatus Aminicenantes bacterium]